VETATVFGERLNIRELLAVALVLMKGLLGEEAVNEAKLAEEGYPEESQSVWGVVVNFRTNKASMPIEKTMAAIRFLSRREFNPGCRRIAFHTLQVIRGMAQWWSIVMPSLRMFLSVVDDLMATEEQVPAHRRRDNGVPRMVEGGTNDQWEALHQFIAIMRDFYLTFPSEAWRRLSEVDLEDTLTWDCRWRMIVPGNLNRSVMFISTDACLEGLGGFNFKRMEWFHSSTKELMKVLSLGGRGLQAWDESEEIGIALWELAAVVVALMIWAFPEKEREPNIWIIFAIDNTNVVSWLTRSKAKPRMAKRLVRNILVKLAMANIRVDFVYIKSEHNYHADFISRITTNSSDHTHLYNKGFTKVGMEIVNRGMKEVWEVPAWNAIEKGREYQPRIDEEEVE
jgi:hypothetical protein